LVLRLKIGSFLVANLFLVKFEINIFIKTELKLTAVFEEAEEGD
jgi:hypothetical protein